MIIHLDDTWFIDADDQSCALTEKRVIQAREEGARGRGKAPKAENVGKERDVQHGFYGTIAQAAQAYLNKGVASMEGVMTASQIVSAWEVMAQRIEHACSGLPRGTSTATKTSLAKPVFDLSKTTGADKTPTTTGIESTPILALPQA